MYHDVQDAFLELIKHCSHVYHGTGQVEISFPEELWNRFEQEFNLCFTDQEDDSFFEQWQEPLED